MGDVPKHRDGLASELTRSKVGGKVEGVDIVYSILECSQGFSPLMRGGLRPKMDSKIFRMVRDVNTLPVRAHLGQPLPYSSTITLITLEGGKNNDAFCRLCLRYTSDYAADPLCVGPCGRRIYPKKSISLHPTLLVYPLYPS